MTEAYSGRSTRAVIDLDAVAGNLQAFRVAVTPTTHFMAVVKANGYGHGATMIARTALANGADELAVATVDEGKRLRVAGIIEPILVLGPIHASEAESALGADLTLAVAEPSLIDAVAFAAHRTGKLANVHLKVDTGMRRYGTPLDLALPMALRIDSDRALRLLGVFSHFASADESDESMTREQFASFLDVLDQLERAGINPGVRHIANSAATLRSRDYNLDLVRIGIALYGIAPSSEIGLWPGMRQALTIHSRVHRVIDLKSGDRISYGGTYEATDNERVALIPIGYADGYHRSLSNRSWMDINAQRAPIRGRVCMDQTVVGIGPEQEIAVGSDVVVIGDGTNAAPTIDEVAALLHTIGYEIATSVSARVPRQYLRDGRIVAVEDLAGLHIVEDTF